MWNGVTDTVRLMDLYILHLSQLIRFGGHELPKTTHYTIRPTIFT